MTHADLTPTARARVPRGGVWRPVPSPRRPSHCLEMLAFQSSNLGVVSAVERTPKGLEWHVSVSRITLQGPARAGRAAVRRVLRDFGMVGAEEDNHVPGGQARNFWMPISPDQRQGCECKLEGPPIVESFGPADSRGDDYLWRP